MLLRLSTFGLVMAAAAAAAAATDSPELGALTERFMKESLALSPISASGAGYHEHKDPRTGRVVALDSLLDDVSPKGFAEQLAFNRQWQARFAKQDSAKLSDQDRADLRLVEDQIALNLLDLTTIESYRHNPTIYVEAVGNALFLPLTQEYAPAEVRLGHVLARVAAIPTFLDQSKQVLVDADPIFVKVAIEENEGNVEMVESTVKEALPAGSPLQKRYDEVAPKAVAALRAFSTWLKDDLGARKTPRTWRLGREWYAEKFKHVMETPVTPEQILADAEKQMQDVRAEMLDLALPMHKEWFPEHCGHDALGARDRENAIIGEVLGKISEEHAERGHLIDAVKADLESIKQFIRDHKIVSLGTRDNLKVMATPPFMRGIYSVAGFHGAPPLEPTAEAEYWVTPIDPKTPDAQAESKLREYNNWTLKWLTIHEALPGHYVQFEHANNVQPERRRLLRNLYGNGCYVEGWAEYIAQVMMDEGFADRSPKFRLMMRKIRLRLLANTILDVRMQTMNMSDDEAMDLMMKQGFQTQAEAEGKLQRAKLSSTQLPTYFVGLRGWQELRKKYEQAKGKSFDMLRYHDLVLDQGPLPLDALEKIILP